MLTIKPAICIQKETNLKFLLRDVFMCFCVLFCGCFFAAEVTHWLDNACREGIILLHKFYPDPWPEKDVAQMHKPHILASQKCSTSQGLKLNVIFSETEKAEATRLIKTWLTELLHKLGDDSQGHAVLLSVQYRLKLRLTLQEQPWEEVCMYSVWFGSSVESEFTENAKLWI